jgi:hypothetical protein
MKRISLGPLFRRVHALESTAAKAAPRHRNRLLDLSIRAMARVWSPEEIEEMVTRAERSDLAELPPDLRRRWAQCLDELSMRYFGKQVAVLIEADASMPALEDSSGLRITSSGHQKAKEHYVQNKK